MNVIHLQKWFYDSYMVLNPGKCYYMTFGLSNTKNEFAVEHFTILFHYFFFCKRTCRNNNQFPFDLLFPFKAIMKKKKLNVLTRIASYFNYNQRWFMYSSFFTRQLSYCPLIRNFCSRQSNHLIIKLQEPALRIT